MGFLHSLAGRNDGGGVSRSAVEKLPYNSVARIEVKPLKKPLYHPDATPLLVSCVWEKSFSMSHQRDGTTPISFAMPLILENELPHWETAKVAETWESMRPYFLGKPHDHISSVFVTQEAGRTINKICNLLIYTRIFGAIRPEDV